MMKKRQSIFVSLTVSAMMGIAGCGGGGTTTEGDTGSVTPASKSAGWYGKTEVSATDASGKVYTHKTSGIFGELIESTDSKDKHDIDGLSNDVMLKVFFPQTTWDEDNGEYFSDYRAYEETESPRNVWTFQVKTGTDLLNAPLSLHLKGTYDVTYLEEDGRINYKEATTINSKRTNTLTLIDVDNAKSYTLAELAKANLNMDGEYVRTFRWVKGEVQESDYDPLEAPVSAKVVGNTNKAVSKTAEISDTGFANPPQLNLNR